MKFYLSCVVAIMLATIGAMAKANTPARPYVLEGTEVHSIQYGEADSYRRYVSEEVFPYVAKHFRADMNRKVFMGHSYGALFGTMVLAHSRPCVQARRTSATALALT